MNAKMINESSLLMSWLLVVVLEPV